MMHRGGSVCNADLALMEHVLTLRQEGSTAQLFLQSPLLGEEGERKLWDWEKPEGSATVSRFGAECR